jgi:hypothetical protein
MAIGQVRVWLPDGGTRTVPLLEEPRRGAELSVLGMRGGWIVSDLRANGDSEVQYDVWVERE